MQVITFDKSLTLEILSSFKKGVDTENYIIDHAGERVLSYDGEPIQMQHLGGITKGSEIYLKSDIISLIRYFETK
jgi:hypothetical protein